MNTKTYEIFTLTGSQIVQAVDVSTAIHLAGNPADLIGVQLADTALPPTTEEVKTGEEISKIFERSFDRWNSSGNFSARESAIEAFEETFKKFALQQGRGTRIKIL